MESIQWLFYMVTIGFIIFTFFANVWITNSHIDRVEERLKKYIDEKLKEKS